MREWSSHTGTTGPGIYAVSTRMDAPGWRHEKRPFISGTKGTLRGTTLLETGRHDPLPLHAGNGGYRRRLGHVAANDAAPRRVRPRGAPRRALPRFHPTAALCEDGLLLLFIAFVREWPALDTACRSRLPERGIAYES